MRLEDDAYLDNEDVLFFHGRDASECMEGAWPCEMFDKLRDVGKGSYGSVQVGRHICTRQFCAIKTFRHSFDEHVGLPQDVIREVACLRRMDSPYIVGMHELLTDDGVYRLVLDGMQRNMKDHYQHAAAMTHFRWHVTQILRGMSHMHSCGWIHRDIKPQNILINDRQQVKLCDMGQAAFHRPGFLKTMEGVGTSWYRAPELYRRDNYDFSVDVWSAGCTLVEMISQCPLFGGQEENIPHLHAAYSENGSDMVEQTKLHLPCIADFLQVCPDRRGSSTCMLSTVESMAPDSTRHSTRHSTRQATSVTKPQAGPMFARQDDINGKMRHILIDWLLLVATKFDLTTPVMESTVSILDALIRKRAIARRQLQMYGMASLLLASKMEHAQRGYLRVADCVYVSANAFTASELLEAEREVWELLEYDMPSFTVRLFAEPAVFFRSVWLFSESRSQHDARDVDEACRRLGTDALVTPLDDKICRLSANVPVDGIRALHGAAALRAAQEMTKRRAEARRAAQETASP